MFNKIILVGNLTRDIELRYSQAGLGIAKTAIATSRKFTANGEKKEEICFVDITFFGRSAEVANQYLRKGSKILVEGRLNFDQWVDQNGQKRSKHSVAVETMQMLDSKGGNQESYSPPMNDDADTDYEPQQGKELSYQKPAQQSYGRNEPAPQQSYGRNEPAPQQSYKKPSYNSQAREQSREMPSRDSVPVIDIDEDEIPF